MNPIAHELRAKIRTRIVQRLTRDYSKGQKPLRADAAAWVLIALGAKEQAEPLNLLNEQLQAAQLVDGRVSVDRRFPDAAWPTPLAVMAWLQTGKSPANLDRAVLFLMQWQGKHFTDGSAAVGHDTSIPGWPWVSGAHSWVEPTSMSLIAVRKAKSKEEPRCVQARDMILNRQLPAGGWNYGNTIVFGRELRPMPHSTGMALTALKDTVQESEVAKSITYLKNSIDNLITPVSLAWSLIALQAWRQPSPRAASLVAECLNLESDLAEYSLSMLGLLYCAVMPDSENPLLG